MGLEVRVAEQADMASLKALRLAAIVAEPVAFLIDVASERARPDEHWHAMLAGRPERFVVGAWREGVAVGMVGFLRQTRPKIAHKGEVWGAYVDAAGRGQGVGRALMDTLLEHAGGCDGLTTVCLGVIEGQTPAQSLYASLGFEVYGREVDAVRVDGVSYDELLMRRPIGGPADADARHESVIELAERQLRAYNRADIDAFCDCYADDVVVLDENGAPTMRGMAEFRPRYGKLFETRSEIHGHITGRVVTLPHLVEHEHWSRIAPDGTPEGGEVLVRYTERDGKIAVVQFFKP